VDGRRDRSDDEEGEQGDPEDLLDRAIAYLAARLWNLGPGALSNKPG